VTQFHEMKVSAGINCLSTILFYYRNYKIMGQGQGQVKWAMTLSLCKKLPALTSPCIWMTMYVGNMWPNVYLSPFKYVSKYAKYNNCNCCMVMNSLLPHGKVVSLCQDYPRGSRSLCILRSHRCSTSITTTTDMTSGRGIYWASILYWHIGLKQGYI
jgi:hypothetical protein